MQIQLFEVEEEKIASEDAFSSSQELIKIIESNRTHKTSNESRVNVEIEKWIECIMEKIEQVLPDRHKYAEIETYIVPCYIRGKSNIQCDGFAYVAEKPVIVVSSYTDLESVFCHELSHVLVHYIVPSSCLYIPTA